MAPDHAVEPLVRPVSRAQRRNDAALAAAMCIGTLISAALSAISGLYGQDQAAFGLSVVYAFALSVPLAFRRRFPCTVAVIVAAAYFVAVSIRIPEVYAGNIAVFIAFYTVGAWTSDRRRATITRVAIIVGMLIWLLVVTFQQATQPSGDTPSTAGAFSPFVAYMLLLLLINLLFFGGAYAFGDRAWAAAEQRVALERRTAELEREREFSAAQAVALDRVRIARELHDVVAHHVSLMGVQAGAARAVLDTDPDAARRTLSAVEESARSALTELRHLLQTLRTSTGGGEDPATAVPAGLEQLPALVAEASSAGLPTTFAQYGDPVAVPSTTGVNLYRIAQEALTNARRHGGSAATADVRVRWSPTDVELEVWNTGHTPHASRAGLGLTGMRERAGASGGTIEAGPRPGGFLVRVRMPVTAAAHV